MATPAAEITIDEPLVATLLAAQCPELAALPIRIVANGWDNTIARVGAQWLVRLPRRAAAADLVVSEQVWLPVLAPQLPLDVPVPCPPSAAQPSPKSCRSSVRPGWNDRPRTGRGVRA